MNAEACRRRACCSALAAVALLLSLPLVAEEVRLRHDSRGGIVAAIASCVFAIDPHDDANATFGTTATLSDARGRLVEHAGHTYQVNALGQRMQKTAAGAGTAFVYDTGGALLGEYDDAAGTVAEYVYLNGVPVAMIRDPSPSPTRYAIYADHLVTPRAIETIDTAEIVWQWPITGAVFGEDPEGRDPADYFAPVSGELLFTMNLRFPGQYFDAESELHYNYFRDYDPRVGRYVQSDPIGLDGGISTYAYVGANSLRSIDPLGLLQGPIPPVVPPPVAPVRPGTWGTIGRICLAVLANPVTVGVGLSVFPTSTSQCDTVDPPPECPKYCPPCITVSGRLVPVGTIGFRPLDIIPDNKKQHGVFGSHHNLFRANQMPYPKCDCFWQKLKNVAKPNELNPDWVPVEPFIK